MGLLTNAATLARDKDFRDRVTAAVVGCARYEMAKTDSDIFRTNYAKAILQAPDNYLEAFAWAMATDPSIAAKGPLSASVTDELLTTQVRATWAFMSAAPPMASVAAGVEATSLRT